MAMIFSILGWACAAILVADFLQEMDVNNKLPQKPFKCVLCLGFWLSIFVNIYWFGAFGIVLSPISGIVAELLDRYLNE